MMTFLAGFLTAVLSGLGIGGGGLLIIFLVLVTGMDQLTAQGVNLIFFLFSSGAAMLVHLLRRKLPFPLIGWMILCGAAGAAAGSLLARQADPAFIRHAFGILLILSGSAALLKR